MNESRFEISEPEWYGHAEPGPSDQQRPDLAALVVERSDSAACTVYPPDIDEPYRTTAWITAMDDSFLAAEDCR